MRTLKLTSIRRDCQIQTDGTGDFTAPLSSTRALPFPSAVSKLEAPPAINLSGISLRGLLKPIPDDSSTSDDIWVFSLNSPELLDAFADQHGQLNPTGDIELTRRLIEQVAVQLERENPLPNDYPRLVAVRHAAWQAPIETEAKIRRISTDPDEEEASIEAHGRLIEDVLYLEGESDLSCWYLIAKFPEARFAVNSQFQIADGDVKLAVVEFEHIDRSSFDWVSQIDTYIHPGDFFLIDLILSVPHLSADDAAAILNFLYRHDFLSQYIRAKLSQFQYESNSKRIWPDTLGRFLQLLDPRWIRSQRPLLLQRDVVRVFRAIPRLNPEAAFVLARILEVYEQCLDGDLVIFTWRFLLTSVFMNDYIGESPVEIDICRNLNQTLSALLKKGTGSGSHRITMEAIDAVRASRNLPDFEVEDDIVPIFSGHLYTVLTLARKIPLSECASSARYFPFVLELFDALAPKIGIAAQRYTRPEPELTLASLSQKRPGVSFDFSNIGGGALEFRIPRDIERILNDPEPEVDEQADTGKTRRLSKFTPGVAGRPSVQESRVMYSSASDEDSLNKDDDAEGELPDRFRDFE
jgi:hypothetical protein